MRKLIIAAAAACTLAACTTTTAPTAAVTGAIAAETAALIRCPRNVVELAVLIGARQAFDVSVGKDLTDDQRRQLADARAMTDRACGIVAATPAPAPSAEPAPPL